MQDPYCNNFILIVIHKTKFKKIFINKAQTRAEVTKSEQGVSIVLISVSSIIVQTFTANNKMSYFSIVHSKED